MMFLTSSILLGFIRLCFILLFLFYLNRKFVNASRHTNLLDFLINNWFRFGSALLIIIFILVALNAYNLFNCMFLLTLLISIDIIGLERITKPRKHFKLQIKKTLLNLLKNIENKKSFWSWFSLNDTKRAKKILLLILTIFIAGIAFLSRYYFIIYDNYSLSDAWIYDLYKVIQFDSQVWFTNDLSINGAFAVVNFYGKITNVSPEIALQVIEILVSSILSLIIFWVINKLTPSKFLAPTIASLSFALIYVLTPLNVYFLLKLNPTFMALTFLLPVFTIFIRPSILKEKKISYFLNFMVVFVAIGLIDIFTLCILLPPFLIIGLLFTKYKYKFHNLLVLLSFIVALGILFGIYSIACFYQKSDLIEYIHSNLLSINSYTYVPQLILPYNVIILYVQYSTVVGFFLVLLLVLFKKENWRAAIIFFLYFNFLILLTFIKSEWIDNDLIKNSLIVFLPIILGFNAAIVIRILNLGLYKLERFNAITVTVIVISSVFLAIHYQQDNIKKLTVSDQTPKQILDAYDKIYQTFFKNSYTVVNDPDTQVISTDKHFFMNYDYFLEEYPRIDSIHFKNIKNPHFLEENPEFELTKSVLVFVLNNNAKDENNAFAINKKLNNALNKEIIKLKKRGRKIRLFYDSEILKVYEIVNESNDSKVSDLIFKI